MSKSDFIDENYELSDKDKRTVFFLFNAEESCNFTTERILLYRILLTYNEQVLSKYATMQNSRGN